VWLCKPPLNFSGQPGWGVWGAISWLTCNSSDLRPGRCQLSGSVAGEVLPIRPDSKDIRDFSRLPTAYNCCLNHEPLTEPRHQHWLRSKVNHSATKKTCDTRVGSYYLVTRLRREKRSTYCVRGVNRTYDYQLRALICWPLSWDVS